MNVKGVANSSVEIIYILRLNRDDNSEKCGGLEVALEDAKLHLTLTLIY